MSRHTQISANGIKIRQTAFSATIDIDGGQIQPSQAQLRRSEKEVAHIIDHLAVHVLLYLGGHALEKRINATIAERTGQPLERVEKDTDRDYWMSPEESVEYGIVGRIINDISEIT